MSDPASLPLAGARRILHARTVAARIRRLLVLWLQRRRQRRRLGELNDYLLKDLGLTRTDVWRERQKSFWRA